MTLLTRPLLESQIPGVSLWRRGKVRDVYDLGEQLLIVATDRISAFDVVLPTAIPDKGAVLTQISLFWFSTLSDVVSSHVVSADVDDHPEALRPHRDQLAGRSMLVWKTEPLPVECVVRGYLAGSGWKDYQRSGAVCGISLEPGLRESDRLPEPIFTPATKAEVGHDENVSFEAVARELGEERSAVLRELSLELYRRAARLAEQAGIILADTKFEFGLRAGRLVWIDEALTPDSSRFWPRDAWQPGRSQSSFDKQFVRDHLESVSWDKKPPAPALPAGVVERTRAKYLEAFERLTGAPLATTEEPA
jgi:phosphoribosylaminoimidazole-succinocarboxamide synthase